MSSTDRKNVFAEIVSELKADGQVRISGFGVFKVVDKPARVGRNPATGETVQIAAKRVVKFSPAKALKEAI